MPTPSDCINGVSVNWGKYVIAGGTALLKKHQAFYNPKMLWVKKAATLNGVNATNIKLISAGVVSADFLADRKIQTLGSDLQNRLNLGLGITAAERIMVSDGVASGD
jgi:hypothetical protein